MLVTPIRVAHVIAPSPLGGAEAVVRSLALASREAGIECDVVALLQNSAPHPWVEELRGAGASVLVVRCGRRRYLAEIGEVARLLKDRGAQLAHTHGYHADLVGLAAAGRAGIPVITSVHGFTGGDWKNRVYEWLQRIAYSRFDAVIAVSAALVERLISRGVPRALVVELPNAWLPGPAPLDRATARLELGLPAGAWVAGFVGRLSREKGADVAIRSMARITDGRTNLSILGDGRERRALEEESRALGLSERVRFHGAVPGAGRLLAAFDVFVLSSRTEGTPMVLFEAMAARVPIVAAGVGGVPVLLPEDSALLVPGEDESALARAIDAVRSDPEGAAVRAQAALDHLSSRHGWRPWLERHAGLYRAVLTGVRRQAGH